jgi:hypothetical protein
MKFAVLLVPVMLLACSPAADTPAPAVQSETGGTEIVAEHAPADAFIARLNALCGQTFEGKVVTDDPLDADFAGQRLVMTVRDCAPTEMRIPFHVGEDKSRTWVVTRTDSGLRLKHDHRHEDGTEDILSQYGGDTTSVGTAVRQEFPADAFSKDLFLREGNPASVDNVWAMEVSDQVFAYELRRPNRFFRVEFNLAAPSSP